MLADEMVTDAVLSPCGEFRYLLKRQWGPLEVGKKPSFLGFLMLNPSSADAAKDDPTIRRCVGFGKQLNFDGILVANLFAYRSPYPEMLKTADDPIGPQNDIHLQQFVHMADLIICAWGTPLANDPEHRDRVKHVLALVAKMQGVTFPCVFCLEVSKDGHPRHPLMLRKDLTPTPWKQRDI